MQIVIVGAGPIGCHTGKLLALKGHQIDIYEEHSKIGLPIQCTGIFTNEIIKLIDLENSLKKNITQIRVHCDTNVEFEMKNPNKIVCRQEFDQMIYKQALDAGAKIHLNSKYISNNSHTIKIKTREGILEKSFDILIGADGPQSCVSKQNGFVQNNNFIGAQIRANWTGKSIDIYPHTGCFGWIVPEGKDIARIGIMSKTNALDKLNKLQELLGIEKIIDRQGGLIPEYNPNKQIVKENICLIGDAAGQVKATTGGGIIPGLIASQILAENIHNLQSYQKQCKQKIGKELRLHLWIRKVLDKFKKKDWDELITILKEEKTKKIIETFDREKPSKFLLKIIITKPTIFKFIRVLLRKGTDF